MSQIEPKIGQVRQEEDGSLYTITNRDIASGDWHLFYANGSVCHCDNRFSIKSDKLIATFENWRDAVKMMIQIKDSK